MSDTENTEQNQGNNVTAVGGTTEGTGQDAEQSDTTEQDSDTVSTSAEAARYRRKLRDAEKQLQSVTEQLNAVQKQHAENMLADLGVKPDAIWAVAELADLLAEDGSIDADKLAQAVAAARERFGIPPTPKGTVVPGVGNQPASQPKLDTWTDAFGPSGSRRR